MACAVRLLDLETLGLAIGSPAYAAPRTGQRQPRPPERDRYSLGVLAYVLLTGGPPFVGSSALAVLLDQIVKQPPSPCVLHPQVPEAAARGFWRCKRKTPSDAARPGQRSVRRFVMETAVSAAA